ncbi:SDR family NAD(P)-dependent oxidoreductase [Saccharothrix obliqua]|uniref:SDR family NAD(P)-dependent oxidoreductase n=1 Tax=Saccharothrix obliqua TaxID=2861747 RepID=UPI001C5F7221|nr:SDR family oxidoreductase [Saccharothrix obliqua]MBW4722343.1 SDR family oxidoreductase [Saccharothrix obliqua]
MIPKKSAIVTGGGTGIGRAVAEELLAIGFEVVITGRRADVLKTTAAEIGAVPLDFDVTRPEQVEAALRELPATVHVLVNNAGGNTDIGRPPAATLADLRDSWTANFEANVIGAVLLTNALAERIADGGRIINISSIAARKGVDGYGAAKAAVETWTGQLARELGPRGITVNAIAPGLVDETGFFGGELPAAHRDVVLAHTPTGRLGLPADIAAVAGFLAGDRSGQLTGQVIPVDGGAE